MAVSRFVLERAENGTFWFRLVAGNGQVIVTSGEYRSRAAAVNGIKSVKGNVPDALIDDRTDAVSGSAPTR